MMTILIMQLLNHLKWKGYLLSADEISPLSVSNARIWSAVISLYFDTREESSSSIMSVLDLIKSAIDLIASNDWLLFAFDNFWKKFFIKSASVIICSEACFRSNSFSYGFGLNLRRFEIIAFYTVLHFSYNILWFHIFLAEDPTLNICWVIGHLFCMFLWNRTFIYSTVTNRSSSIKR